jgi:exodeoxyribonuclease-5
MSDITLTPDQERFASALLTHGARGVGYAGTGKTLCLTRAAEAAYDRGMPVTVASPTNKAAAVIRALLPKHIEVGTLHSLTTTPAEVDDKDEDGNVIGKKMVFSPRGDKVAAHVLIDESSMVGAHFFDRIKDQLSSYAMIGDPFQLAPVKDRQMLTEEGATVKLTEVMRQALDSPALAWATQMRATGATKTPDGVEVVQGVLPEHMDELSHKDSICITFTNNDRHWLNEQIRLRRWGRKGWIPEVGDKVISRDNMREVGIFNGQQGIVEAVLSVDDGMAKVEILWDGTAYPLKHSIDERRLKGRKIPWDDQHGDQIDYSYAVTCHSAQGSGWPRVFIVPSKKLLLSKLGRPGMLRWLYTAATRIQGNGLLTIIDTD